MVHSKDRLQNKAISSSKSDDHVAGWHWMVRTFERTNLGENSPNAYAIF
jgi:hypothetical protein